MNFGEGELENARVEVLRLDIFPENGLDGLRGLLQKRSALVMPPDD